MKTPLFIFVVALLTAVRPTHAATYDESVLGDLSDAPSAPTAWALDAGANQLIGGAGTAADYDLVALTVPSGHQLDSIVLDSFSLDFTFSSFLGLQGGSTWTTGLGSSVSGDALIGWELIDDGYLGVDLLPNMATNAESTNPGNGLTPPLPSGAYTLLLQDTSSPFTYQLTFNVSVVPEPAGVLLAGVGLAALALMRMRMS